MKNIRRGRPKGAKEGSRSRDTQVVSMRLSKSMLDILDNARKELSNLFDIDVSRSLMVELLIDGKGNIKRYKRLIKNKS